MRKIIFGAETDGELIARYETIWKTAFKKQNGFSEEEFQKKIEAIREASRVKMLGLLRDDQKAKFNEIQENREQMIHAMGERKPKHFGKGEMFPRVRHFEFLNTIIYKPLLERMSKDLNLDEQQKKSFEEILVQRRKEVLDLIDSTPPPSIEAWGERPPPPPPSPF